MPAIAATTLPAAAIPEKTLRFSMRMNTLAGGLGMVWMAAALGMPLPLLMRAVEASGFQLGLLSAAWQVAMLAQLPSALVVERLPRRKEFWAVLCIVHRLLWGVPALLPIVLPERLELWPAVIIATLALSNVLGQAATAPWQSWMADLLPPERAGRFWGARHRVISVCIIVAALGSGAVLDRFSGGAHPFLGFQLVFAAAALFGTADIVVHCWVWEPAPHPSHPEARVWERIAAPLRSAAFRRLTLGMGAWACAQALAGYTLGLPGFFNSVYLKESFGATYSQAAWVFIGTAAGALLWSPAIGRAIDRWGAQRVAVGLLAGGPSLMLGWFVVGPGSWELPGVAVPVPRAVVVMSAAALLTGGAYAGILLCHYRLTQALTTPAGRTVAMGVHWSLVGAFGAAGPLLAGWIKDHVPAGWGPALLPGASPPGYYHVLVLGHVALAWGVAVPLLSRVDRSRILSAD